MKLFKHGLDGFLLFFSIILFAKLLNYLLISDKFISIGSNDFFLALLGFVYVVLLKTMEKYSKPLGDRFKNW